MIRVLKYMTLLCLLVFFTSSASLADRVKSSSKSFTVKIPGIIEVEGIGPAPKSRIYGVPENSEVDFNLLVNNSKTDDYWQLTTNEPIGISVSYNTPGTIMAVFVSMYREQDGYKLPQSDLSVYPSKVLFDRSPNGGDVQRIFHFSPIIRVSKRTPPGSYSGIITFTVLGQ